MNGPRSTGPEYTGKHRRDSGPGVLPPAWPTRAESYGRPAPDSRVGPVAAALPNRRTESGFRPEAGNRPDAG
ncbi:MAG TPA: hypothetical protein VGS06_21005 [Streptosporangiaceae bacterium]|nr:hypothetical protein [Streptosporangiaceae bacterium]